MPRQLTLVALYGEKRSPAFVELVGTCQRIAAGVLGEAFTPYAMEQVHATIVGLERHAVGAIGNAAFAQLRGRDEPMDIAGFVRHLRASAHLPMRIQLGGFREGELPHLSRGPSPYEGSVAVRGETAVLVGWPVPRQKPARATQEVSGVRPLDSIRREAQRFGILHRYHPTPASTDDDFFFRIGLVASGAPEARMALAERRIRAAMSEQAPVTFSVGLHDLSLVAYTDTTLPPGSTESWPLTDPGLDAAFLAGLYA
ncbi:hypothetical protein [Rubricoccus marinus]|uniref:Uncharacterized protein n=1 Tax=Rubricoccus marinus TaxID=716817 RepID=A0A259TWD1_9BACT|nr:hypothetical protein [Rubricoccus marinus]OZC02053.1 hypothetical protein BSZ36_03080 [Rubricoccus marinus]